MDATKINLRYPGRCKSCGDELDQGTRAWHFKAEKKVECLACHDRSSPRARSVAPPGSQDAKTPRPGRVVTAGKTTAPSTEPIGEQALPGTSARREYERRTNKRKGELQDRWGSKLGKLVWLMEEEQRSTSAWAKGAKGEEKVGAYLEKKLDGTGCEILHDRRIPGGHANIDHIVIGPAGVTVIDAKNIKGDCRTKTTGIGRRKQTLLMVDDYDNTTLITGVTRQVDVVKAVLAESDLGFPVAVSGMLCWWNIEGLPLIGTNKIEIDGVKVMNPRMTANFAGRKGSLGIGRIQTVADCLDGRLVAA